MSTQTLFILHTNSFPGRPSSTYRPVFAWIIWEARLMELWQYFEGMMNCIITSSLRVTIKFPIPASFRGLCVKFTLNIQIYNFWWLGYGYHRQGFCHPFFVVFKITPLSPRRCPSEDLLLMRKIKFSLSQSKLLDDFDLKRICSLEKNTLIDSRRNFSTPTCYIK